MAQESSDFQYNWADVTDAAEVSEVNGVNEFNGANEVNMECDDPASYAEAASGRRRSDSCLSNTAGLFMVRHDRMSEEDREHIHLGRANGAYGIHSFFSAFRLSFGSHKT